jgi:hypothetical protein
LFFISEVRGEELNVYFKTSPRLELLRPFADPADMALLVTAEDGRPVDSGTVTIQLDAPASGKFFSTDMPLVEGTRLNEMTLGLRQGRANWKYLFPIRGEYRLTVNVLGPGGKKLVKAFAFQIHENESKWLALGGFSAALVVLGFLAGRIFTKTTGQAAVMILALSSAAPARSALGPTPEGPPVSKLIIQPATVGKLAQIAWSLESGGQPDWRAVFLTLTVTHLEKGKIMFALEKLPVTGEFSIQFHFPDGAEYRVTAVADVPGLAPLRSEQVISVTGIEPPARAALPVIAYFIVLIALGLGCGRWSKLRVRAV